MSDEEKEGKITSLENEFGFIDGNVFFTDRVALFKASEVLNQNLFANKRAPVFIIPGVSTLTKLLYVKTTNCPN